MILSADKVIFGDARIMPRKVAVRIHDGKIDSIGPVEELVIRYPEDDVISYPGGTLMPGLIDAHTHISGLVPFTPQERHYPELLTMRVAYRLHEALKSGVTTVRDLGSPEGMANAMKISAEKGYIKIPRLFTSDRALVITGGHGTVLEGGVGVFECDGESEVRKAVRSQIKKGVDWIKLMDSEGYRGEEFTQEELDTAVAEAHRFGKPVAAHAGWSPSVDMCIKAGVDTIEHGTSMTMDHAESMKQRGCTLVPTLLAFKSAAAFLKNNETIPFVSGDYADLAVEKGKNVKAFYEMGLRIACGTDCPPGKYPPLPVADEVKCMVEIGLTPLQAIEAATKNGAEALYEGDCLGQIKEGYIADILVVDGDPESDVEMLKHVKAVYLNGKNV